jgi:hypothetical protein
MTVTQGGGGCPGEANAPPGAPSPVDDTEQVVRCVPVSTDLVWNQGVPVLGFVAIRREDLEGKNGKSFSVLRDNPLTPAHEITRRATAQNQQPQWASDPVVARAEVIGLRRLTDTYASNPGWRLVCVNADPTDATDQLGACPTHASVVRSNPIPGKEQRAQWLAARSAVAAAFKLVRHASGAAVAPLHRQQPHSIVG